MYIMNTFIKSSHPRGFFLAFPPISHIVLGTTTEIFSLNLFCLQFQHCNGRFMSPAHFCWKSERKDLVVVNISRHLDRPFLFTTKPEKPRQWNLFFHCHFLCPKRSLETRTFVKLVEQRMMSSIHNFLI